MVTTIQVDEETQRKLVQVMAEIQAETGRRVSYDEALKVLFKRDERIKRARKHFEKFYGFLSDEEEKVWRELRNLKKQEKEKLEHRS